MTFWEQPRPSWDLSEKRNHMRLRSFNFGYVVLVASLPLSGLMFKTITGGVIALNLLQIFRRRARSVVKITNNTFLSNEELQILRTKIQKQLDTDSQGVFVPQVNQKGRKKK